MEGWIKLHRKILTSSIFENERLLKFWIWILLKASYEERKTRVKTKEVSLNPGQFVLHISSAVKELKMPRTTIYRFLDILESEQKLDKKWDGNGTVVTVGNWAFYQCGDFENGTAMGRGWDGDGTLKKNYNNINNINNNTHIRARTREEKVQCSEFVFLTPKQYEELVTKFGHEDSDRLIEILDNYKRGCQKDFDDDYDYKAIFGWCVDRLSKNKNEGVYTDDEDDEYLQMLRSMNERNQRSEVKC